MLSYFFFVREELLHSTKIVFFFFWIKPSAWKVPNNLFLVVLWLFLRLKWRYLTLLNLSWIFFLRERDLFTRLQCKIFSFFKEFFWNKTKTNFLIFIASVHIFFKHFLKTCLIKLYELITCRLCIRWLYLCAFTKHLKLKESVDPGHCFSSKWQKGEKYPSSDLTRNRKCREAQIHDTFSKF